MITITSINLNRLSNNSINLPFGYNLVFTYTAALATTATPITKANRVSDIILSILALF